MKKQLLKPILLGISGICFMTSLSILVNPIQSSANSVNQQFVSTKCIVPGGQFMCNDCKSGNSTCFDHSCEQCNPGGAIQ